MIVWRIGPTAHQLDAELQRGAACLVHLEERDGKPGRVDVIAVPADRLEELRDCCDALIRERDAPRGQLVLFSERRVAA